MVIPAVAGGICIGVLIERYRSPDDAPIMSTRACAAFALARWNRYSDLEREAQRVLANLAQRDATAQNILDDLKAFGTHGGSIPGTTAP